MRGLLFALLLVVAGAAQAQETETAPREIDRLGPFTFGMTRQEAAVAAPANWLNGNVRQATQFMSSSGDAISLSGIGFQASLGFTNRRLDQISLFHGHDSPNAESCLHRLRAVVATVEAELGPFNGRPARVEATPLTASERTAGGSEIRIYRHEPVGAQLAIATLNGSRDVTANAYYGRQRFNFAGDAPMRCAISVSIRDTPPTDIPPAPTHEELQSATLLSPAPWAVRPDGDAISRNYPLIASENRIDGQATLACLIAEAGRVRCAVSNETPADLGFGAAALGISHVFRMATEHNGEATLGKRVNVTIRFDSPERNR